MGTVSLLDARGEEPRSKLLRYVVSGLVFAMLLALGVWYVFRFYTEKKTVESFFQALAAGDTQQAYRTWKPGASYTYQDFLEDWGPTGYYGPVRSYRIRTAQKPKNATGVIVVVSVSPQEKFPGQSDPRTQQVRIWVERRDQSLSFPP